MLTRTRQLYTKQAVLLSDTGIPIPLISVPFVSFSVSNLWFVLVCLLVAVVWFCFLIGFSQ